MVVSKRFAKGNNLMCKTYDPTKPISWLIYLDANNLYWWAMSQPLPTHGFRWSTNEEIEKLDISNLLTDVPDGFMFEVDLAYPVEIHDEHSDYPLTPQRLTGN